MTSDLHPLWLSLKIGLIATAISLVVGSALGYWIAHLRATLRRWIGAFILLPLALPPTVLGYYLLVVIGRRGWIGRTWESVFGEPIVFTQKAAVIAACVSTIPIVARQLAGAFAATSTDVVEAARIDGATGRSLLVHIYLPLVRASALAAAAIAFARAVGDFGTTLMVAGNLPGRTQTAALAIYDRVNAGRDTDALFLSICISILCLVILAGVASRELAPETSRSKPS